MPFRKTFPIALLSASVLLTSILTSPLTAADDEIWNAARLGDLERVRALLAAGADVDTPTRYGATSLTFAAEKGHLEVVRLLLEKGADPDPRDSFYNSTPMGWALRGGHLEIATLLAGRGASDIDSAIPVAVQAGAIELVAAVLSQGPLYAYQRNAGLALARQAKHKEMEALFDKAGVKPLASLAVEAELLRKYAGSYKVANGERVIEFFVQGEGLGLREAGKDDTELVAISDVHFRSRQDDDFGLLFYGRRGTVEGVIALQGTAQLAFAPLAEADEPPKPKRPLFAGKKKDAPRPPELPAESPKAPRAEPIQWGTFRGANASGVGDGQGVPTTWDVETGENVKWKTEIPGLGLSSPVVWGNRVFVTTAVSSAGDNSIKTGLHGDFAVVDDLSEHTWKVLALDKNTGKIAWWRDAGSAVPLTTRHTKSSQANSSPATDGRRVVVVFPTAGLFCYDMAGELLWKKSLGALDAGWFYDASYQWGFASSPVIYDDLVILQADVQEGSFIAAYDLATGSEVWKTERDEIPTWATPTVYRGEKRHELIANGTTIRGYNPRTGQQLWSLGPNAEVIIATPILAHGLIYVTASYPPARPIYAIRPGASGDISLAGGATSSDAIAWSQERGGSYMPTPIVYGDVLYIGHHQGRMAAYNALTGERLYRARFSRGGTFTGSPVAADGRLFFSTEEGLIYVVKAAEKYEEIAVNDMKAVLMTTPAISDGALFVRTRTHLYALGE